MRPAGHPRLHRLRRFLKEKVVWPILDAHDFVLRRDRRRQLYTVHRPSRRVRIRWGLLHAWDALVAPLSRMHLRARARAQGPAAALGVLVLAGTTGVAYAAWSDEDQGSRPGEATQARPAPSPAPAEPPATPTAPPTTPATPPASDGGGGTGGGGVPAP